MVLVTILAMATPGSNTKYSGDKVACYDDNATYDSCHQGRGSCLIVIDSTDKIAFNAFHHKGDGTKTA